MTNNNKRLTIELMKGLADGSIDLDKAPVLKKMIQDYLHNFDYQIERPINNLKTKADNYNQSLINTANDKYHGIIKTGNTYQQALKTAVARRYSKEKVDQLVNNAIHNNVSKISGISRPIINNYLKAVRNNTQRLNTLSKNAKTATRNVKDANHRMNKLNSRFWYGICGAFILGAIFSFIAL